MTERESESEREREKEIESLARVVEDTVKSVTGVREGERARARARERECYLSRGEHGEESDGDRAATWS
jgi:hypothetical protein